jgi:hypothetical protein
MCNAIKWIFAAAYLVLLGMVTVGLLTTGSDHFSSLLLIGLPWTLFLDSLWATDFYIGVSPTALILLAPAINLAILFSICRPCADVERFPKGECGKSTST